MTAGRAITTIETTKLGILTHKKKSVYSPVDGKPKVCKLPPYGTKVSVLPGFHLDTQIQGIARSFKIGIQDKRTKRIDFESSFDLSVTSAGTLTLGAQTEMKTLVSAGRGQIAYEFVIPGARLVSTQSEVTPKDFDWVSEIILGFRVQGFLSEELFEEQRMDANVSAGFNMSVDGEQASAGFSAGGGYHATKAPKTLCSRMEQAGGVVLVPCKFESTDLVKLYHHLESKWAKDSLMRPDTWMVSMVKIVRGQKDQLDQMSPHTVVLGRAGVGKSSFLNSFLGGKKGYAGGEKFSTSQGVTDASASHTKKVESELVELDAITADSTGNALEVTQAFRLTDVPGFGAADLPDAKIIADLLMKLSTPKCRRVHTIVWVERFDETRMSGDHFDMLQVLESHFGNKLWDLMTIVLTSFPYPKMNSKSAAKQAAQQMMVERAREIKTTIVTRMPHVKDIWADRRNMIFCMDNFHAQIPDMDLEKKFKKASDPTSEATTEVDWLTEARNWSKDQIEQLKLHLVTRTRNNVFWDSQEGTGREFPGSDVRANPQGNFTSANLPFNPVHIHSMQCHSFVKPTYCGECKEFLMGFSDQGQLCCDETCGYTLCHACADGGVPNVISVNGKSSTRGDSDRAGSTRAGSSGTGSQ